MAILQSMVRALSCPRVAVAAAPGTSDGQIVLQVGLDDSVDPQTRAVFRHCRLNRTQFNYARDFARENIVRIIADRDTTDYLETADKAIALFGHLLDQKKHASNPEELSQLNDCVADVYALVLSTYGQSRCVAPAPLLHEATPADACRHVSELLAQAPRPAPPGGPFWQCITFDETRHDGSQQYRLLDPLLEFQVNKLLDSVRAAQAHLGSSSPDASADPAQGTQQLPAAAPAKLPASGEPAADGAAA
ncbi:hypothetical protein IWQ56_006882 [Coemansia nantahalensis]|nr:hypothetical protein IWQ56_006882 [Coemansia nantahalensis]